MDEKKRNTCYVCNIIGVIALFVYLILTVAGRDPYLLTIRLRVAGAALISYVIKFGVEISSGESFGNSAFFIAVCLFNIIFTAVLRPKRKIFLFLARGFFFYLIVKYHFPIR